MKHFVLNKEMPIKMMLHDPDSESLSVRTYQVCFSIITDAVDHTEQGIREAQKQQNISFAKVTSFIDYFINDSIMVDKNWFDNNLDKIAAIQNTMVTLPIVAEDCFVAALHCKFNTITSENTHIDTVKLIDLDEKISYDYTMIDEENYMELPDVSDWSTEFSYWDTPWWFRNDICTMDRNASNQEEKNLWDRSFIDNDLQDANYKLFADIESEFEIMFSGEETPKEGEIIEVDFAEKKQWKPRVI